MRNTAKHKAMDEEFAEAIKPEDVSARSWGQRFSIRRYTRTSDTAGVVTGLAWTSVGGDILLIESS